MINNEKDILVCGVILGQWYFLYVGSLLDPRQYLAHGTIYLLRRVVGTI